MPLLLSQVTSHWEKFSEAEHVQLVQLAFSLFQQGEQLSTMSHSHMESIIFKDNQYLAEQYLNARQSVYC